MNKAFEKILENIENLKLPFPDKCPSYYGNTNKLLDATKEIVQEVAEEFAADTNVGTNGWIPCSERLPSGLDFVLYTCKDGEVDICSIEYFYDYLNKFTAWQPLPSPFREIEVNSNDD